MDKINKESVGGLAGVGGPIGTTHHIFVSKIQSPTMLRPEYCVQNDIITDNIVMMNNDGDLKARSSKYLNGKRVKMYKYIGDDVTKKMKNIVSNLNKPVTREFIYESLTDKVMYDDDQIEYDTLFEEVDFDRIKAYIENSAYTVLNKYVYYVKPDIVDTLYSQVNNEEAALVLNKYRCNEDICIMKDKYLGYFAVNRKTLRRTNYFNEIGDIVIYSDIKEGNDEII